MMAFWSPGAVMQLLFSGEEASADVGLHLCVDMSCHVVAAVGAVLLW